MLSITAVFSWTLLALQEPNPDSRITDKSLGFTIILPTGFKRLQSIPAGNPNIVHAFSLERLDLEAPGIFLFIERMHGILGPEQLDPNVSRQLPPGFQGKVSKSHWQRFELDTFEVPEQFGSTKTLTYNVQIPLKREAIQVKLFGPATHEVELRSLLSEILKGLHGETN